MTVFPSYTEGVFRVANSNSDAPITDISVFNAVGQLVFQKKDNAHSEVIDLSAMPSGLYFVQGTIDGALFVEKVFKRF